MANSVNTVESLDSIAAKVGAQMIAEKVQFARVIDKEDPSIFGRSFQSVQPGQTISINKPARFTVGRSLDVTAQIQNFEEEKATLTLDQVSTIALNFGSDEIVTQLDFDRWAERVLDPALSDIAQDIDARLVAAAMNATSNFVGTPGTVAGSVKTFLQAKQKLQESAVPRNDGLYCLVNSAAETEMVDARKGLFNDQRQVSDQYLNGLIARADGFRYLSSDLLPTFTTGTQAGYAGALSNGVDQVGDTIAIDGMTAGATITKGTVVTFADVKEVHPVLKTAYPYDKQFVVTEDVTLNGAGAGSLKISPALVAAAGGTKNASAAIADGAQVTFASGTAASTSYGQNLSFHRSAVRACFAELPLPKGVDMAARETVDGISISVVRDFIPTTRQFLIRFDVLWGYSIVRPEWMCRITN